MSIINRFVVFPLSYGCAYSGAAHASAVAGGVISLQLSFDTEPALEDMQ